MLYDGLYVGGVGEDKDYVEQEVKMDERIKYLGRLENDAKILVNLRSPEEKLTN